MTNVHQSVFLEEAVDALQITPGDVVVDATLGGAGHFGSILNRLQNEGTVIGIDADAEAVARGEEVAKTSQGATAKVVLGNFRDLESILDENGVEEISSILFDLGWSSYHLSSGRGFSFRVDEPLMMTYGDPSKGGTAAEVVNSATEQELSDIFHSLGEERFARQIARGIVRARGEKRILTTAELAEVVTASTPSWYHSRRIHPATKVFQALRMHVNDELGALRAGLTAALTRLEDGGRVAVITFHSIEDRIVKTMLRDAAHEGKGVLVTKKPVEPSDAEVAQNPRARSAKLRVFEKTSAGAAARSDFSLHAYV